MAVDAQSDSRLPIEDAVVELSTQSIRGDLTPQTVHKTYSRDVVVQCLLWRATAPIDHHRLAGRPHALDVPVGDHALGAPHEQAGFSPGARHRRHDTEAVKCKFSSALRCARNTHLLQTYACACKSNEPIKCHIDVGECRLPFHVQRNGRGRMRPGDPHIPKRQAGKEVPAAQRVGVFQVDSVAAERLELAVANDQLTLTSRVRPQHVKTVVIRIDAADPLERDPIVRKQKCVYATALSATGICVEAVDGEVSQHDIVYVRR